jgi:hypothetical protein
MEIHILSAGNSWNKSSQDPELEIARKYGFKMLEKS